VQKAKAKFEISARDKSRSTLNKFMSRVNRVKGSIFSLKVGVVGLAGAAGLGLLVRKSLESADSLAKTADKLGISTKALAGLRHAADLTGASQKTLDKGLQNMVVNIAEYSKGTGEAKRELEALGFSQQELMSMSPDQQFSAIADSINRVENSTEKVNIAYKIFGGRATELLNALSLGSNGLRETAEEADALGLSISRIDAAKIENANDAMARMKGVATGLGNAIAAEVSPFITALATQFVDAAKEAGGMSNFVSRGMEKVVGAVGFAADMVRGLQVVWKGLQVIALGAISAIITGLDEVNRAGATALDWIPGLDVTPIAALSMWAEESRNALISTMDEMDRLANLSMPSEGIKKWSADIQHEALTAAKAIAKTKAKMIGSGGDGSAPVTNNDAAEARQAAALSKSVDAVQQSMLTEEQRIMESYDRRSFMIEDAFQNQLISEQYKNELIAGLAVQHEAQKTAIARRGEADRRAVMSAGLGAAANIFGALSSLMGKSGKKQNAMQKVLARAGIIASTAQAVMNALAVPPYPLGLSLAAGAALQGAVQLRAVGGSGGGSISSPVSSAASQFQQSQPIPQQPITPGAGVQEFRITMDWENATPDQIDQMAGSLARNMANGGKSPVAA